MPSLRLQTALLGLSCLCVAAHAQDKFQTGIPASSVRQLEAIKVSYKMTGNRAQAETALKTLIGKQPDYYAANYDLGLILADQGIYPEAVSYLETAKSIRERKQVKDATIYNSLGWAYMLKGDTQSALANFNTGKANEEKLTLESRARLYNNLGLLYMSTGQYSESRQALQVAADKYGNKLATQNLVTLNRLAAQQTEAAAPGKK